MNTLMVDNEKKKPANSHGRDTTDESLRTERKKTDAELAASQTSIKDDADAILAKARQKADSVLEDARDLEDRKLVAEGSSVEVAQSLDNERAREDVALEVERVGTDAAARIERGHRQVALASLLAFERQDTDIRLEIERAQADKALTSREDFLAIVTHDLRSLLGGIAVRASLLTRLAKTNDPEDKVARNAEGIQRLVARMNRLIGDLMDVASIEAGRLSLRPERQDVTGLVRDSMEAFQPAASARGIEFRCETADAPMLAEFDHERILQVLANLVGNALKFTPEGGQISLRVQSRGEEVGFAVEDTGEGIPSDRLEMIFDRFFQGHPGDRRGLGLGLYISKSIVEAHGGRIWAESVPGRGSTFFFVIPARVTGGPHPVPIVDGPKTGN